MTQRKDETEDKLLSEYGKEIVEYGCEDVYRGKIFQIRIDGDYISIGVNFFNDYEGSFSGYHDTLWEGLGLNEAERMAEDILKAVKEARADSS